MGIDGNDYVDNIASCRSNYLDAALLPVYGCDVKAQDKFKSIQSWQTRWDQSEFGRHLYDIESFINKTSLVLLFRPI